MIRQLRPFHTEEELAEIYTAPYDHTHWEDHRLRVEVTTHIARWMRDYVAAERAADLSCGDGAILSGLHMPREKCVYGDLVEAKRLDVTGPIESTLRHLDPVDLFILSETLEHVRHPRQLLARLRVKTHGLVLSTPVGEKDDANPEHLWGWDVDDIADLLLEAGFEAVNCTLLDPQVPDGYTYQIWGCV